MAQALDPIIIVPDGDLILEVRQDETSAKFAYRVDSNVLRRHSPYFERMLSDRFLEGQDFSAALNALRAGDSNIADVPAESLPRIGIVFVGRISKVSSIQKLVADFFRAVHNQDISPQPPIANLANLAVVADFFDCLPYTARFVQRKKYMQAIDAKTKNRSSASLPEERARQKLLIGLFFDYSPWVTKYSKQLILGDSSQWRPDVVMDDNAALWLDLPNVEDELIKRREYILETINSLQAHFLKKYTSGERQCKLGYDSSVQCDSFQLGEMVRFFSRIGTLRLQGTIYDPRAPTCHSGDISRLIESLRQCPSYQIDRNHAHCGLRTRLMPLLDHMKTQLSLDAASPDIGICAHCWEKDRDMYAWSLAKRPVLWIQPTSTGNRSLASASTTKGHQRTPNSCLGRHNFVRDMFMAQERNWTAEDVY